MVEIDPHVVPKPTVAFLLSLSNKRTRHYFTGTPILARLQLRGPLPGFQTSKFGSTLEREIQLEGEVFNDVEA